MIKRRYHAVLLAAVLALSACAQQPKPIATAPVSPAVSPNEKVGETKTAFLWDAEAPPKPGDYGRIDLPDDQLFCLAQAIYFEAGAEPMAGQQAVGAVILNRVRDGRFPKSVCGVVKEGGEGPPGSCQFSWFCDGKPDDVGDGERWRVAQQAAADVLQAGFDDPTDGALFFHNRTVKPAWSRKLKRTAAIGGHLFYR
jgi:spore germination cell wall hydrolase CwlJ-like protein